MMRRLTLTVSTQRLRLSGLTPGRAVRERIWMVLMHVDVKIAETTASRYQNDLRINHLQKL